MKRIVGALIVSLFAACGGEDAEPVDCPADYQLVPEAEFMCFEKTDNAEIYNCAAPFMKKRADCFRQDGKEQGAVYWECSLRCLRIELIDGMDPGACYDACPPPPG